MVGLPPGPEHHRSETERAYLDTGVCELSGLHCSMVGRALRGPAWREASGVSIGSGSYGDHRGERPLRGRRCAPEGGPVHGGKLVARALADRGVDKLFTLSGGHLFSIYDGCVAEGIEIIDTRHEQSAAWAAEGYAKATRRPGVAALTAGPGVTNGMSAMAGAKFNRSPLVVLGGRAPEMRWGSG